MASPVTQIHYLTIDTSKDLTDTDSEAGKAWTRALDLLEHFSGFRRLYWGRSPEDETKVQLHVVRDTRAQHQAFLSSPEHTAFQAILQTLVSSSSPSPPLVRHAQLRDFTPGSQALGCGAPVSGTAVYVSTDAAWHEGAWPLWTHIVPAVDGCLGCSGGPLEEVVDGHGSCYLVYVGWETVAKHDAYHHTRHFARHGIILRKGNKGWREYGHVRFEGAREGGVKGKL
ncbi:hypothetical protein JX265_011120 [Neoarthrinium moseri]|uniref:ABM domain-containing protein n=1 Tax=Neoarthrinium moseri TaxID=1658444 RepID=A0A9P9WCV9_9PEZI|nr:hypothetical protein JX265_011120 [Neoarthrinium moseri]